jgi:hypothetical protein
MAVFMVLQLPGSVGVCVCVRVCFLFLLLTTHAEHTQNTSRTQAEHLFGAVFARGVFRRGHQPPFLAPLALAVEQRLTVAALVGVGVGGGGGWGGVGRD